MSLWQLNESLHCAQENTVLRLWITGSLHLHTLIYDVLLTSKTTQHPTQSVSQSPFPFPFPAPHLPPHLFPMLSPSTGATSIIPYHHPFPFFSPSISPAFLQSFLSITYPQGSLMNKPYPALLGRSPDDAHNWPNVAIVTFLSCADTTVSPENISFPIFTFPKPNFTAKFRQSPLLQLLANYLFR